MFALWIAWQILECSNQILILNNISVLILQYDASLHKLIHARIGRIRWQVLANFFYRHLLLNAKGQFISNNIFANKCYCLRSRYKDWMHSKQNTNQWWMKKYVHSLALFTTSSIIAQSQTTRSDKCRIG